MKKSFLILLPTLTLLLGACGNSDKPDVDTTDREKPTVNFTVPIKEITSNTTITVDAKDNVKVAKVDFYDNGILVTSKTDAPYQFTTSYTTSNNGQHVIKAVATDSSGNSNETTQTLTVNIATTSKDTTKPTVELTVPSKITSSNTIVFTINANDNVKVAKVEIYEDDILLKSMESAPYQYTKSYSSSNNGKHTIKVVVTDSSGNQASTSQIIEVAVDAVTTPLPVPNPTPIDVTSPTLKVTIPNEITATDTTISAIATDNVTVSRVEFYDNGKLVATVKQPPYTYSPNYTSADNGDHIIKVVAVDDSGNQKEEVKTVKVSIKAIDTENPTVTLTVPATVTSSDEVTYSAEAKDNEGISSVEFYDNDTLIKKVTTAPYSVTAKYDNSTEGKHVIKAIAYDNSGNKTETTQETLVDLTKPTLDFSIPESTVSVGDYTLSATVEAKDNISVAKVEIYDNDKLVNTLTQAPYTINQKYTESGQHNIKVVATDSAGNQTEKSSTFNIKVINSTINTESQLKTHEPRQLTSDLPGTVTWSSSQPDVIAVSPTGEVTGLRLTVDPVTITATAADGQKQTVQLTTYGLELTMCTMYQKELGGATALRLCATSKFRTKSGPILGNTDPNVNTDWKAITLKNASGETVPLSLSVRPSEDGQIAVFSYHTRYAPEAGTYTAQVDYDGQTYKASSVMNPSDHIEGLINPELAVTTNEYSIRGTFGPNVGAVRLWCNSRNYGYIGDSKTSVHTTLPVTKTAAEVGRTSFNYVRCDFVSFTANPYDFTKVTPNQLNMAWQTGPLPLPTHF